MADFGTIFIFLCGSFVGVVLLMAAALVRISGLASKREEQMMADQVTKATLKDEALGWHKAAIEWREAAEKYRRALESIFAVCRTVGTNDHMGRYAALEIAEKALGKEADAQPDDSNPVADAMAAFYGGEE